ncbi:MAG: fasciclin domain-containing protein [Acidimicrobiia bacterium]|nr:fasciclin domain-containing protein [Acidimicrobiia bacterium]
MRRLTILLALVVVMTTLAIPSALAADTTRAPAGDSVGVFNPDQGEWTLRDRFGAETSFFFGDPGDYPFMGDWDGDGVDTPGLYRQSDGHVYLRNSNTAGIADVRFFFGDPGDVPLAGDWDGDGDDTLSVYRPSNQTFYIVNELGANGAGLGAAETSFVFGDPGDMPFAGDFDGDGDDTVGLQRQSTGKVYFTNSLMAGPADADFIFGNPGDVILASDWTLDGTDTVGIFRPSEGRFFLNYANAPTVANIDFYLGNSSYMPLSGSFDLGADIVDVAVADGRFTTLAAALGAADLVDTLKGPGPFTVFAPTDDAFAALEASSPGIIDALLADIPALTDILLYHVASGEVPATTAFTLDSAVTVQGQKVYVTVDAGKLFINDAEVIINDVFASNGVIHVIDMVLQPKDIVDTAIAEGAFTTLVTALSATEGTSNLVTALRGEGPFTVLAPTDAAFAALEASSPGITAALLADPGGALTDILLYHVLSGEAPASTVVTLDSATTLQGQKVYITLDGGSVFVNDAEVIVTDVYASNGVIHVIDTVLQPLDIVDTAIAEGAFSTLVAALSATQGTTNLVDALRADGPFTVFAPTDAAFEALEASSPGILATLLADPGGALTDILLYHVLAGENLAADVIAAAPFSPATLEGSTVDITLDGENVKVDAATVILTDVLTSNGVIHVIDAVITP